jgi:hypothetical protein
MPQRESPVEDLVVRNARVFDGTKLLDQLQSVAIAKGRITFVGPSAMPARKEIDATGRFLMPGLIDCHLHLLNMWTALDEASMGADIKGDLKTRLRALLDAGVTTVKSVGDSEDDILRVRDMLAAGEVIGPTLYASGGVFAAPGSHPATTVYGKNPWMRKRTVFETDSPKKRERRCGARLSTGSTPSRSCTRADVSMGIRISSEFQPSKWTFRFSDWSAQCWKQSSTNRTSRGSKRPCIPWTNDRLSRHSKQARMAWNME